MASDNIYDQHTTPDTASAALTTLFASTEQYPHLELSIDPSLDAPSGATAPAPADDGAVEGDVGVDKDAAGPSKRRISDTVVDVAGDADQATDAADDAGAGTTGTGAVKRKATSRINMLPRGGACEFCKRRKLKCTAEQPQCRACARSGRECVYSQKQQRSRVRVLEDKLLELERRLDQERQANASNQTGNQPSAATTTAATGPSTSSPNVLAPPIPAWMSSSTGSVAADTSPGSGTSPAQPLPSQFLGTETTIHGAPSTGVELFLGLGADAFNLANMPFGPNKGREPDLMTLADAAASDANDLSSWPWEGMSPQDIASEIYKTVVENHKGMGEKIITHLLQSYARPPHIQYIHAMVDPTYFFDRLSGAKGQPPHPAMVSAMIPNILVMSPNPALNNRETIAAVSDTLFPTSRALAQHALSNLDSRVIDLVTAAMLRCCGLSAMGRFVDGWNENSLACGLVWGTGIGKLGHVLGEFAPPELRSADRASRHSREERLRRIRGKGQIVPPPTDVTDCVQRIHTFWCVYIADRANALGWNWPSALDYTEITTPLPHDSYDTPADLVDNSTLEDFMSGRSMDASKDGIFALQVKSITILYEAARLLDKGPEFATPDKTAHLLRISKRFMATMPKFTATNRDDAVRYSGINDTWMTMHAAMMLLHGKDEVDAETPEEEREACDKGIAEGIKMCDCIDMAIAAGDTELMGYDLLSPTSWFITGRAMHHYARRIESRDPAMASLLRKKISGLIDASRKVSAHLRLAEVYAQILHNITLDAEAMLGEYERPDNTEFAPSPEFSAL